MPRCRARNDCRLVIRCSIRLLRARDQNRLRLQLRFLAELFFAELRGARWWTLATVVACGATLLSNTIYFNDGNPPRFLLEKGDLAETPWWLAAFYFHVVGASLCLAAGCPLMFPEWTRRHPKWHRRLGYLYVNAVLWMVAPSGLALASVAKGGLWSTVGFGLAGVLWWQTTWSGYRAIRRRDITAHVRAMVRSYAWALSAPAFRAIQASLFLAGAEDNANYVVSLWLSIAASVWLAEAFLDRSRRSAMESSRLPPQNLGVLT
jgi:uncharacterized membrane protein